MKGLLVVGRRMDEDEEVVVGFSESCEQAVMG